MAYRPFLSHKRDDAEDLRFLKDELRFRGAGGWQDVDDLNVGQRFKAAIRRAIGRETGGFIWWGTRASLTSRIICRIEVPAALRRQRLGRRGYPVVPLFVDLSPNDDEDLIRQAFRRGRGRALCDRNGLVRGPSEPVPAFASRAARDYVKSLIREHPRNDLRIAITGGREPSDGYDLVLDWRELLDGHGRPCDAESVSRLVEALADIRVAAQSRAQIPEIVVEPHLRLPLAALVGWEWNRVRPVNLRIVQASPWGVIEVKDDQVSGHGLPTPADLTRREVGPHVVALSVGKNLGEAVPRYADGIEARGSTHLHLEGPLDADGICRASAWVIEQLSGLSSEGVEKHLLLLGPSSLAVRIGASSNGTGRTTVPFWDGDNGYSSAIVVGA